MASSPTDGQRIVPAWMLGDDGKTLTDFAGFADMMVTMLEWAKRKEGWILRYFGPPQ